MLCDQCKQNPATYHMIQVVNGAKTETHLCQQCLSEQQGTGQVDSAHLISGLLGRSPVSASPRCSLCGLDYARFQQTGQLGCAQCYQDFRNQLTPMLQRIHGTVQHQGHVPQSAGEAVKARRRLDALKKEMQEAVQVEDFERAASLRDLVRAAQQELEQIQHPLGADVAKEAQQAKEQEAADVPAPAPQEHPPEDTEEASHE